MTYDLNKEYQLDQPKDYENILDYAIENDLKINVSKEKLNTVYLTDERVLND